MAEPRSPMASRPARPYRSARLWLAALMLAFAAGSAWLLLFHTPDPYQDKTMLRKGGWLMDEAASGAGRAGHCAHQRPHA